MALHDPRYIIRGYDPLTYGGEEYIKDEDVVRPFNYKFSQKIDLTNNWKQKNTGDAQTYGTCDVCFDSGPIWQTCRFCGTPQFYATFSFGMAELDSITLSESLERGLRRQRTNRTCIWHRAPIKYVSIKFLQTAVGKNRELSEVDRTRIFDQVMDMLPYDPKFYLPDRVGNTNM